MTEPKENHVARTQRWREQNPSLYKRGTREHKLWSKYRITWEWWQAQIILQDSKCAACLDPPTKRGLFVDHNHTTGKVRALLCQPCNWALGHVRDSAEVCRRLAQYLDNNS